MNKKSLLCTGNRKYVQSTAKTPFDSKAKNSRRLRAKDHSIARNKAKG